MYHVSLLKLCLYHKREFVQFIISNEFVISKLF